MSLYDTIQEEGKDQGQKRILTRLLKNKFSQPLPENIKDKIESADEDKILMLSDKIFEIKSIDDVREILEE